MPINTLIITLLLGLQDSDGPLDTMFIKLEEQSLVIGADTPCYAYLTVTNRTSEHVVYTRRHFVRDLGLAVRRKDGRPLTDSKKIQRQYEIEDREPAEGSFIEYYFDPGETKRFMINLHRYFDLEQPGEYEVYLRDPKSSIRAQTKSGKQVPASRSKRAIMATRREPPPKPQ